MVPELRQKCTCRKPASGMIEQACRELSLDPTRSFMIGDRRLDVVAGHGAGTRTDSRAHRPWRARSGDAARRRAPRCYPQQFDGGGWLDSADVLALIDALPGRRVAVIGDAIADEFVYGRVARVSREAPVLILEYDSTAGRAGRRRQRGQQRRRHGRLRAAGRRHRPRRAGAPADQGRCTARVNPRPLVRSARRAAPPSRRGSWRAASTRPSSRSSASIASPAAALDKTTRDAFFRAAVSAALRSDAVLVSDYGGGLVSPAIVSKIRGELKRAGHPVPILVDSRYRLLSYSGLTACTPNESEVEQALGVRINDDARVLERAGAPDPRADEDAGRADHARQPRHGAVRAGRSRPCTFRSSDRMKSPT